MKTDGILHEYRGYIIDVEKRFDQATDQWIGSYLILLGNRVVDRKLSCEPASHHVTAGENAVKEARPVIDQLISANTARED